MANDILKAKTSNDIKNGTIVVGCKPTGFSDKDVLDTYVLNTPTLETIQSKFDNRFYNGIFVELTGSNQIIVGG
jgi:hypothetical protein